MSATSRVIPPRARPEDSIKLRAVVLAAVMVAVFAVIAQGAVDTATAVVAIVLIPVAYVASYVRRGRRNIALKTFLAFAMLAALGSFILQVQTANSVDQARADLASLFLWVQVIHSFDLPRRRDLSFSIGASLTLMAEAGVLSLSTDFLLFLVPYAGLGAAWLYLSQRSQAEAGSAPVVIRRAPARRAARATGARGIAIVAVLGLLASSAVFLAMPRVRATQIVAPPFSLTNAVPVPEFSGAVVNPGLPDDGASVASSFLPDAYPGFGAGLDLRARGRLSQQIVMKVRSPQAAFWRAQAYDNFDGTTWTATNDTINEIATGNPTILPTDPLETPPVPSKEMLQTFYVEKQQPNVIFAAARPSQLYFPASTIATDGYSSMRAPILLEEGVIYSVVSDVPEVTPAMLRGSNTAELPSEFPQQYLQVPEEMPARVSRLAHQITDGEQTAYDKVLAVQRWLKENTEYKLDIPRDPPGVDAVDYFLFERRQGFCEHIASSMVMLLRAAGIPARLAVGFDSGERNAFTGYFEVRQADAHSWVEVYYPRFGWIEYDPTHAVPLADPGVGNAFVAPQVLRAIGRFIARVIPEPVKAVARSAWSSVASAAKWTARTWPVMVVAVLLVAAGFLALRRYLRRSRRGPPPTGAAAAFVSMCDTFAARGRPRREFQTPSEHVSRLLGEDWVARNAHNDMLRIVRTFERERFAPAKPDPREIQEAIEAAGRLKAQAAHAPGRRR